MRAIFQRLYDWSMRAGSGPGALRLVGLVSFAESALLPLPVDAVTLPVMLADRGQIKAVVLWATITSVLGGALTPIPFKLIAICSGVQALDLWLFLGVAFAGRLLRFAAFGLLVWYLGQSVRKFLERRAGLAGWTMLALLLGGFVATTWL